ncbi:hypothetical protein G7Y89_g9596 [Cudoniella acicularis]|uniref:GH16 domain-containing protein n=1 Tax=Cudoniella acicularis TaxID=354080 RepID=A0A8H4RI20_9HELO|nr:hypothetical protein G7Y89_g9596 [Cudoniella acicularis]
MAPLNTLFCFLSTLSLFVSASGYQLVQNYNASNWFDSFFYNNGPDPTGGTVNYTTLAQAQALGLTKIVNNQVYFGAESTQVVSGIGSDFGRKSVWLQSNLEFTHGVLIGDFAHVPSSACGTWPAFWTIHNEGNNNGEIDIFESFSDTPHNYMTLHTTNPSLNCTFNPPDNSETGRVDNGTTDCNLHTDQPNQNYDGCSIRAPDGSYGDALNQNGVVYAMEWTSAHIRIWYWPGGTVPSDITNGNPNPAGWGMPAGNFDTTNGGNCDLDANFLSQGVWFDITFCGMEAGGDAWSSYGDCAAKTGVATCEDYVRNNPSAFTSAYFLVNSVKIYQ